LELDLGAADADAAVAAASFHSMRKQEASGEFGLRVYPKSAERLVDADKSGARAREGGLQCMPSTRAITCLRESIYTFVENLKGDAHSSRDELKRVASDRERRLQR